MQPASQVLCNKEIIAIFSTAYLCTEVFSHEEKKVERSDIDASLHSQEGLLPESAFVHQNDGLQTKFSNFSQDILGFLEENILIYNEEAISDDHEECVDILFQKNPEHDKVEQGVDLDEVCYLNP